jgi:hypothetical protein
VKANITEITARNGYPANGAQVVQSSSAQAAGTCKLVLYNDTPTSPADPLIDRWDDGTSITITAGNGFTVDLDQAGGVFTLL